LGFAKEFVAGFVGALLRVLKAEAELVVQLILKRCNA
jgi:predicted HicB family RNase H-like nuclease